MRLTDGLDSATEKVGDYSEAVVTRSTIAAVPAGSQAIVQLAADAKGGGFGMQLQQVRVGSTVMCTASSSAVLAGGWPARMNNKLRVPGAPRDAVSGARVFVPETTDVEFTLTAPPPPSSPAMSTRVAPTPRAPTPPAHPAPTIVDLPPTAPGYPPLHASRPAADSCWWVPFVSERYGLEMPVQRCAKATDNVL